MAKQRKTQADQTVERLEEHRRNVRDRYDAELAAKARERDAALAAIDDSITAVKTQPVRKRRAKVAQIAQAV